MQIIIIGRGHSGTRVMAKMLELSGFASGNLNDSGDMIPGQYMYQAVKMFGNEMLFSRTYDWDFSALIDGAPPMIFRELVERYLEQLPDGDVFWKLPETALALPWLVQMFPDAYYIHWVRDGRDNILGYHDTENLRRWRIPAPMTGDRYINAAVSWRYHEALIDATPKPEHWLKIRFRDAVLNNGVVVEQVGNYLGRAIEPIPMCADVVGRWCNADVDLAPCVEIMRPYLELHQFMEVLV